MYLECHFADLKCQACKIAKTPKSTIKLFKSRWLWNDSSINFYANFWYDKWFWSYVLEEEGGCVEEGGEEGGCVEEEGGVEEGVTHE